MPDYSAMTDEQLAALAKDEKDKAAFTVLAVRYLGPTKGYVINNWKNVIHPSEALNFARDMMSDMWFETIPKFDPAQASFRTFHYLRVSNHLKDLARKKKIYFEDVVTRHDEAYIPARDVDHEIEVRRAILAKQIQEAVEKVANPDYRRATMFWLLYPHVNQDYLAELSGVTGVNFRTYLRRGRIETGNCFKEQYQYDAKDGVGEVLTGCSNKILDRIELIQSIKRASVAKLFREIPEYETLAKLEIGLNIKEKGVIKMVKEGLDDIAPGKNSRTAGSELSADKADAAIEKGFQSAASGKKKGKRKTRGATATEKYEDLGRFMYFMYNDAPEAEKKKPLIEIVEEQVKRKNMTMKQAGEQFGLTLPEFAKVLTGKTKPEKAFHDKVEQFSGKSLQISESIGVMPEKFEAEGTRQRKVRLDEDVKSVMSVLKKISKDRN